MSAMPDTALEIAGAIAFACFAVYCSAKGIADMRRAWRPDIGGKKAFLTRLLPLWLIAVAGYLMIVYGDKSGRTALLVIGAVIFIAGFIPFAAIVWRIQKKLEASRKN